MSCLVVLSCTPASLVRMLVYKMYIKSREVQGLSRMEFGRGSKGSLLVIKGSCGSARVLCPLVSVSCGWSI